MLMVAIVVLLHAERILLVQEAKPRVRGTWNLPGGRVEPGEALTDAALRETQEEAGLSVHLRGLLFADQVLGDAYSGESRMRFVFVADPAELPDPASGSELRVKTQPDEHSLCARWFSRHELSGLSLRNRYVIEMVDLAARAPQLLPMTSVRARFGDIPPASPHDHGAGHSRRPRR
ncbi:MAG: hypothetical protein RL701_3620 [Pseudomonadota bacterium]